MQIGFILFTVIIAYLLGSVPSSVWVGRIFYNLDVREHGSGNAGTTNTFRVLGVKAGIVVFILDAAKGWLAASLVYMSNSLEPGTNSFVTLSIILGSAAVVGHIFPIYVGFRGGKGVATLFGVVMSIHLQAALLALAVFVVILLISRYVSLSSMLAGISFPIITIAVFKTTLLSLVIFSIVISLLLLVTHQHNILRLIRREESKANLFRRKKRD
ncbi:MAG: acyl-phosphate glycerol 3-phosphate acyltransferase [Bacteroidia bacterium]|nr:MAG: acyl-phosphate glycerol 3-phosphate acyltransferase [Bacteroidia bacterium]